MKTLAQISKTNIIACFLMFLGMLTAFYGFSSEPREYVFETGKTTRLAGDANCDGSVDILDVIAISNYIIGLPPEPFCFENADVNNDGVINLSDLIATVNIIVGGGWFTCGTSTVTDSDGNVYNTVLIDDQCWMQENLKTTKYRNGSDILNVVNNSAWVNLTSGAYCWYSNDIVYKNSYGALYNWYAINPATNGGNDLCPAGWRVATDEDYIILVNFLGGNVPTGGKMKETGFVYWNPPNTGATNESGFSARAGGSRIYNGNFDSRGTYCWLWTATEQQGNFAYLRNMFHNATNIGRGNINKNNGQSVRCLKE